MQRAQQLRERLEVIFERERRRCGELEDRIARALQFACRDRLEPTNG